MCPGITVCSGENPNHITTQAQGNSEAAGRCSSVGGTRRPSRKGRREGQVEKAPGFSPGSVAAPLAETVESIRKIVALAFALKLAQIFVCTDSAISTRFNWLPGKTPKMVILSN